MCARSKPARTIELQARDIEVLRGLFESRVMSTDHISAIYFDGRYEMARKRLQKLSAAGLVARYAAIELRTPPFILTSKGLGELDARGVPQEYPAFVSSLDRRTRVSPLTLRHELEVMDVKASLIGAARIAGIQVTECTTWPLLNQFEAPRGRVVKPDAHVRIVEPQHDGGTREHQLFVEVDRSTESQSVLLERARDYVASHRAGTSVARAPDRKHPFRVLFVLKTANRRNITIERFLRHSPPIPNFIWLATTEDVVRDPFGKIWIAPGDCRGIFSDPSGGLGRHVNRWEHGQSVRSNELIDECVPRRSLLS